MTRVGVEDAPWTRPDLSTLKLEYRFTSSVVEDFAAGHTPADVLRELVQNEYDAEGSSMSIEFGEDTLRVIGSGKPIDAAGWKRLSVMMGTGTVAGSDDEIVEKVNDLGSKNFGIRSLFLFGDRIFLHSRGHLTVLDLHKGAPPQPIPDAGSKRALGVRIEVPYRTRATTKLEPFSVEREAQAFDGVFRELAATLVKLAQPGARKDLRSLVISSRRLGRTIRWRQTVKEVRSPLPGVRVLRRIATVEETKTSAEGEPAHETRRVEEIEFQKTLALPPEHQERRFPGYFRVRGNKLRIAVSLPIRRDRIDLAHPGCHYSPLGALNDLTGTAVSVSAPFAMDSDRSRITDTEWNQWLLERAADAAVELLGGDWLARFEGDAYLALLSREETPFSKLVSKRLREATCWPTRARAGKRKPAPVLHPIAGLVTYPAGDLGGFVADEQVLEDRMRAGPALRSMAEAFGARPFGLASLLRLRCAGDDARALAGSFDITRDANYRYPTFPSPLRSLEIQRKFAVAIDAHWDDLSVAQRKVLRGSPTTLTAAGTLAAPGGDVAASLWAVDPALASVCPLPETERLHPELFGFKALRGLCRPFKVADWMETVVRRIAGGQVKDLEREALYRYVCSSQTRLDRKTQQLLHRCPMLRDHRGAWASPASIILRSAPGAETLEPVLSFPHADYASNAEVVRALRFRSKIEGDDLVRYAAVVAKDPARAEEFETMLHRRLSLLSNADVERLKLIPFLRTSRGTLALPTAVFVRNSTNQGSLGPDAHYPVASHPALHERLGCRKVPLAAWIAAYLEQLRQTGTMPERLDILYPALVEAIGRERSAKARYERTPILWTTLGYRCPADTVLGIHRDLLGGAVPQQPTDLPAVVKAYRELGASLVPRPEHWGLVLTWLDRKYRETGGPLLPRERKAVHSAYEHLVKIPDTVPHSARCLLDREGFLHTTAELSLDRYVIDDDPPLASAAAKHGVKICFADIDERTLRFHGLLGVKRLTEVRRAMGYEVGAVRPSPKELVAARLLGAIRSANFSSALAALLLQRRSAGGWVARGAIQDRLQSFQDVVLVESLSAVYEVAGTRVTVPVQAAFDAGRVILTSVRRTFQAFSRLAQPIAALAGGTVPEQRDLADAIYRLLTDPSPAGMKAYLEGRGVPWSPADDADPTDENDEEPDSSAAEGERELAKSAISQALMGALDDAVPGDGAEGDGSDETNATEEDPTAEGAGDEETGERASDEPVQVELPDLDEVIVELLDVSEEWTLQSLKRGSGSKGGAGFDPATRDPARDRQVGRRGEELALRKELERVRAFWRSAPETVVVWTSDGNPAANHDIRSIDEDGETIWIEVKSTSGRDGRFHWAKAEFELALAKRSRYVLCRVYEADTKRAFVKYFRDPIGMLERQAMHLAIGTLRADVEPLDT